ncbi:restriction endonuclease subunit S [Bacillus sp. BF9-10]|uniref:restriction endonuclease subunit S n=1 Tax=Bacillus sp. BF9-10 TaxID=2217822 RepID=UPI0011C92D18|nr:restriction endonuclease subunit S [Bacillus sp. BF9-10]TXR78295.1 restriction endonuclease subunit S [Bacillus sp. BF9-10]
MTEQTNLVPKRRFKEFQNTHAWKQHKLGEISNSFEYGLNASATFFDGINKYIRITDIDDNSRLFNQSALTSPGVDLSNADNYLIKNGDILFARTGASVGKTYRYQESDGKVYYAGFLIRARINQDFDSEFVFQNTLTPKYDNFIKITSQRSGQPGVNAQEYASFDLMVPTLEEQQKIGTFFKDLDGTIALHQRKLEKTKALKSAYLSEMFPAEGEREPKRRFAEFTQAWEQRKLGEVVNITMGQSPNGVNYTENPDDHILVQGNADIKNGWVVPRVWTTQVTKSADKGDIILSVRAPVGDVGKTQYDVVLGRGVAGIKGNEFIFQLLSKMKSNGFWTIYSTGSTFESINSNDLKEAIISIPEEAEQTKIGSFFKQLDETIALHQRKLEKLQNIKKAYLNEMFV